MNQQKIEDVVKATVLRIAILCAKGTMICIVLQTITFLRDQPYRSDEFGTTFTYCLM
jgi:hypothetical protein